MCLSFSHHAFSFCLSLFICDISVFLSCHLVRVFFLFSLLLSFCRSPPLPQSPLAFVRCNFLFVVVLFSTLLCISHYYSYPHLLCFFLPWKWLQENGGFTSGRVLFLDQILLNGPVPREREILPALLTSSNKKYTFSNMYTNLFSLYVCVSVFLWPLGVCVEWDVTGRLPCSTHKSNSTCFFSFLGLTWCPRLPTLHTPALPQNRVCVWYTQALVLDRPYMPPSNPSCTHTHLKAKED